MPLSIIEIFKENEINLCGCNRLQIIDLVTKRLIEQEDIDIDYYEIIFKMISNEPDVVKDATRFIVSYELKMKKCWFDLEETAERLKIGL